MTEEGKDQSLRRKARGEEGDGKDRGLAVTEVSTPLLAACARTFICRTIVDGAGRPMRPNLPAASAPARTGDSPAAGALPPAPVGNELCCFSLRGRVGAKASRVFILFYILFQQKGSKRTENSIIYIQFIYRKRKLKSVLGYEIIGGSL